MRGIKKCFRYEKSWKKIVNLCLNIDYKVKKNI